MNIKSFNNKQCTAKETEKYTVLELECNVLVSLMLLILAKGAHEGAEQAAHDESAVTRSEAVAFVRNY